VEARRHGCMWLALRGHADQHTVEQLEFLVFECTQLDQPLVFLAPQRPEGEPLLQWQLAIFVVESLALHACNHSKWVGIGLLETVARLAAVAVKRTGASRSRRRRGAGGIFLQRTCV